MRQPEHAALNEPPPTQSDVWSCQWRHPIHLCSHALLLAACSLSCAAQTKACPALQPLMYGLVAEQWLCWRSCWQAPAEPLGEA